MKNITLGITGATGIPIAFTLLDKLLSLGCLVQLVITNAGIITAKQEAGISLSANPNSTKAVLINELKLSNTDNLLVHGINDWYAPIASGGNVSEAMVICPCSMATLGKIVNGIGDDLLCRAADVIMKERKNLVLVPRETPLSAIHLGNMQKLAQLQVSILPPMLEFYTHPKSIEDMIEFIVSRILDQLGLANSMVQRWGDN